MTFLEIIKVESSLSNKLKQQEGLTSRIASFESGVNYFSKKTKEIELKPKQSKTIIFPSNKDPTSVKKIHKSEITHLPLALICEDPENVRKSYDPKELERLAKSMETHGLIEPVTVIKKNNQYQLVAGHRRYRAAKIAKLKTLRAVELIYLDDIEIKKLQIVEDSQAAFKKSERARSWFRAFRLKCIEENKIPSISQFAKSEGIQYDSVREAFSYLSLPEQVKSLVELGILKYSVATEISYLPHRFKTLKTQNPELKTQNSNESDLLFLDPKIILKKTYNSYESLQIKLALRAAYFGFSKKQIKEIIAEYNPNSDSPIFFSQEELEKITETNTQSKVIEDVMQKLYLFEPTIFALSKKDLPQYEKNIYHHPRIVSKFAKVKQAFYELKQALEKKQIKSTLEYFIKC